MTEIEPDWPTIAWGLCDLGMGFPEFGTVDLSELEACRDELDLDIACDPSFVARGPISAYIEAAVKVGHIIERITVATKEGVS